MQKYWLPSFCAVLFEVELMSFVDYKGADEFASFPKVCYAHNYCTCVTCGGLRLFLLGVVLVAGGEKAGDL